MCDWERWMDTSYLLYIICERELSFGCYYRPVIAELAAYKHWSKTFFLIAMGYISLHAVIWSFLRTGVTLIYYILVASQALWQALLTQYSCSSHQPCDIHVISPIYE